MSLLDRMKDGLGITKVPLNFVGELLSVKVRSNQLLLEFKGAYVTLQGDEYDIEEEKEFYKDMCGRWFRVVVDEYFIISAIETTNERTYYKTSSFKEVCPNEYA